MSKGFFTGASLHQSRQPESTIAQCGACGLYRSCQSPKMSVYGEGRRKILIVGEAPGRQEDAEGIPFVGESGSILESALTSIDSEFDLDVDVWRTNAIICRPSKNRTPTDKEVGYCRPNVLRAIRELQPNVIILLGGSALRSVVGHLWKSSPGSISQWVGKRIPSRRFNAWVCPTYHPAYLARDERNVGLRLWFERHLEEALKLEGKPYLGEIYGHNVRQVYDVDEAIDLIERVIVSGQLTAFDYETNMLKPDSKQAEIVSCAICWQGKRTFAFPWHTRIQEAMKRYLLSDVPKIAANAKFEDRWSKAILGVHVNKIVWDTMQAAHVLDNRVLDNREGICSVKYQSFVRLGVDLYNEEIEPFLESSGSNEPNRIKEIPIADLLHYNGLDAIYEYEIAMDQLQEMGIPL